MAHEELQVESGNYTRIVNKVIEELVKTPLLGAELAICLFIIRKTYGFNKKEDEISLTQFEKATGRSRPTIVKALKNLQLVKVIKLVKIGDSKLHSNLWTFNKYHETWEVVNRRKLVKKSTSTSKEIANKLVKRGKHTKDNIQKTTTKERATSVAGTRKDKYTPLGAEVIRAFEKVDPKNKGYYNNTTQRSSSDFLIEEYGLEEVKKRISFLPQSNKLPYFPSITTPYQLKENWVKLQDKVEQYKSERKLKSKVQEII